MTPEEALSLDAQNVQLINDKIDALLVDLKFLMGKTGDVGSAILRRNEVRLKDCRAEMVNWQEHRKMYSHAANGQLYPTTSVD